MIIYQFLQAELQRRKFPEDVSQRLGVMFIKFGHLLVFLKIKNILCDFIFPSEITSCITM